METVSLLNQRCNRRKLPLKCLTGPKDDPCILTRDFQPQVNPHQTYLPYQYPTYFLQSVTAKEENMTTCQSIDVPRDIVQSFWMELQFTQAGVVIWMV